MKQVIDRLFAWLEHNARTVRERELVKYFSQATDASELEQLMRALERRGSI